MNVRHSTELNIFDVEGYIKDKTPQKIKLTLAVNEDIVQWNPTITSNLLDSFTASSWYLNGWDNTLTVGTWIKKTDRIFFKATFKTELYGLETATFGGAECVVSKADNWSDSTNIWDIRMLGTVGDLSQIFNLDVYELIRFEDIVQPYPVLLRFKDENGNEVSWGGKFRVGSTITRIGSAADSNLLPNIYNIFGLLLNDNQVTSSKVIVEKTMVFKAKSAYIFDNNEPKCILSPSRLRIPNSSYKLLGYIPDISGHGNNGKINNSAYEGMSGMNGYPVVFGANKTWKSIVANNGTPWNYKLTPTSINIYKSDPIGSFFIRTYIILNGVINSITIPEFKIKVSNLKDGEIVQYHYVSNDNNSIVSSVSIRTNGIHILPASVPIVTEDVSANKSIGFTFKLNDNINEDGVTIEILPKYEGSFCLDGVDDFVTIPTLVTKQSLIKCNWTTQNYNKFLVDYRKDNASNGYSTNKIGSTDIQLAYNGRVTYIDGILNKNLIPDDNLKEITHCATIQYPNNVESETTIASAFDLRGYMQMALYTYIAFSEFSTEEKIKELNEYVGTEGNIVEWNPTITSNIPYKDISTYITTDGTTDLSPKVGNLYKKGDKLTIGIKPVKDLDEVGTVTVNGVKVKRSSLTELGYYIYDTVLDSTQIIDITIDEYIKYEDIVQPFPTIFELKNVDTNVTYTYGSKLKIGSEFLFDKWTNLLPELYRPTGSGRYNGNEFKIGNTYIVERTMTFSWSSPMEYLLDSEPKCIFSPSKLRMPNESYRYLGYIPDISGNGNNGVFNNFAFSKMSGVNGYLEDFTTLRDYGIKGIVRTDSKIYLDESFDYDKGFWLGYTNVPSPAYKVKISGIPETGMLTYTGGVWLNLTNGINELPARTNTAENHGFVVQSPNLDWSNLVIEQIPEYEGSICFDGVDDYITIPTLSEGGKQVLMKVNWQKQDTMLYNQNPGQDHFAIFANDYNNNNLVVAYASRNNGNTYIDGVVNNNILATQLKGITHNIVATNNNIDATITPIIGSNKNHDNFFAQMALYDFMLFDEISTDEEIKELNNIVGIEGDYVQKPSYYWDAYGKTNFDIDKDIIPQRGTEKGYNLGNFTTNWYYKTDSNSVSIVTRSPYSVTLRRLEGTNDFEFRNTELKSIASPVTVKFRPNKDIGFIYDYHYRKVGESGEGPVLSKGVKMIANEEFTFSVNPVSQDDIDKYNIDVSTGYYMLYFRLNTFAVDEEVTIEMLPVEGGKSLALTNNNFAYDKMSGYGGYSFKSFNDSQDSWNIRGDGTGVEIVSRDGYSMTVKKLVQNLDWNISNNEYKYPTILNKELPFKCKSNKNVGLIWQLKYKTEGATADTTVTLLNQQLTPNVPLEVSLPYKTQDELTELGAVSTSVYYLLYFSNTLLEIGEEYTIEMLPLYPNGLVFDGVDDYSENTSIPALADYTYICKRSILNIPTNGATLLKGSHKTNGGAFIADYGNKWQFNFGQYNTIQGIVDGINWQTTNNFNGTPINKGNNTDDEGITVGRFSNGYTNMVFYKLFLYPRTVNMLSINMVKNMMEEDGIIDLTSKLFTDKYTGDFYEMDFNNDFLIGN